MSERHPLASRAYAEALAGREAVIAVPEWGAHVTRRPTPDGLCDAIGTYPLQVFARGADLAGGLQRLAAEGLVSMVMVPDPLLCPAAGLARDFAVCRPFKTHFLVEPARGFEPSKHHRERIRRGHRRCDVRQVALGDHLADWTALYDGLVARHSITGPAAFSEAYFRMLAAEPAICAFAAFVDGACAGMTLWFEAEGAVYNHLTAANELGYRNGANFALYDAAIARFMDAGVMNLGGGAGFADADDGLTAFKRGFANGEVQAHICGAVLDQAAYDRLSAGRDGTRFFPAYRAPMAAAAA
ncbi:GNAT family N-acetyltransferase [Phenylobacterium sp.]|jgi:hypothetical protein|uniref:GNAT family N-acetyltransferase n=1 Tax=Phenylobacterium sp. TaxID=1871053 RepID=UPI002F41B957